MLLSRSEHSVKCVQRNRALLDDIHYMQRNYVQNVVCTFSIHRYIITQACPKSECRAIAVIETANSTEGRIQERYVPQLNIKQNILQSR